MAYNANEKYSALYSNQNDLKRLNPSSVQPKQFASGSGSIAPLQAVAFNTSTNMWVPWANGGANGTGTISGFAEREIVLDADEEVLGNVIMGGQIHMDDIPVFGGTATQLKAACVSLRSLGFNIQGLPDFR